MFTELERLDLNEDEGLMLFEASPRRGRCIEKRDQRKCRQLPDKLTMLEASESPHKSKISVGKLKAISICANCGSLKSSESTAPSVKGTNGSAHAVCTAGVTTF